MKKLILLTCIGFLPVSSSADTSAEEIAATMININGYLCAEVVELNKLESGNFEVTCIKYRGGSGKATYIVDVKSGNAFPE